MQDDAADQLHVEVPHVEDAAAGFADCGKGFGQQIVERRAVRDSLFEINRFGGKIVIRELLHRRLQIVDGRDDRTHRLDFALVASAENLGQTVASINSKP